MKQHITPEMLNELTDEQKECLREWWKPKRGDRFILSFDDEAYINEADDCVQCNEFFTNKDATFPILSIGQCIELLGDKIDDFGVQYMDTTCNWVVWIGHDMEYCKVSYMADELIHALWQAVKEVL